MQNRVARCGDELTYTDDPSLASRVHDPGFGAVPADARGRSVEGRLVPGFPAADDPLAAAAATLLLADAPRLSAGTRRLS